MWSCETCRIEVRAGLGLCEACARTCHFGHKLKYEGVSKGKCTCKSRNCVFAGVDLQWNVVDRARQWVCVSQDGEKNRVFVSEQVSDFSAKDFREVLGLKNNECLAVVRGSRQTLLKPDTTGVLRKYPDLKLEERPEAYDSPWCLRIVPEDTDEFVLLCELVAENAEIKQRVLPMVSVGMKECELANMKGGELIHCAKQQLSKEMKYKQCDLYVKKANSAVWSKIDKDMEVRALLNEDARWQIRCELDEAEVQEVTHWIQIMDDLAANEATVVSHLNEIATWYRDNVEERSADALVFKGLNEALEGHRLLKEKIDEASTFNRQLCIGMVFNKHWQRDIDRQFLSNVDLMMKVVELRNPVKSSLFKKKKKEPHPSVMPFLHLMDLYGLREESVDKGIYLRLFEDLYKSVPKRARDRPFIRKTILALFDFRQEMLSGSRCPGADLISNLFEAPAEIVHMPVFDEEVMVAE